MTRSTPFRFSRFEISFGILAACALMLSPQAALAQHGGSGHAGGGHAATAGHFGSAGGGARAGEAAGASVGATGHAYAGSHVGSSPIHVFSGPRSAPAAADPARAAENSAAAIALMNERARVSAIQPRSSNISASPFIGSPHGAAAFAEPRGSAEPNADPRLATPMHTTIGFPPSTNPRFVSITGAHRGAPLMITGQGQQAWQTSRDAAANRDSVGVSEIRVRRGAFPKPPHIFRRPPLSGAPFLISSPGFIFFSPTFGFFGPGFGFGCDPFWAPTFGCGGLYPCSFGFGCGGYSYLGLGGYGDMGYGYDGGYYAPPSFDVTTPNPDEGASQEPAPSEWQNPPADNSTPDNSGAENQQQAPDTIIYLKDGTSFAVKDYWVADGQLHYLTSYGGENSVDLGAFDLERTTNENAARGVSITFRPAPESQPQAPPPPPPQDSQPPTQ